MPEEPDPNLDLIPPADNDRLAPLSGAGLAAAMPEDEGKSYLGDRVAIEALLRNAIAEFTDRWMAIRVQSEMQGAASTDLAEARRIARILYGDDPGAILFPGGRDRRSPCDSGNVHCTFPAWGAATAAERWINGRRNFTAAIGGRDPTHFSGIMEQTHLRPKVPRNACDWFGRGELFRLAMDALRGAQEPLTAGQVAQAVMAAKRLTASPHAVRRITGMVDAMLRRRGDLMQRVIYGRRKVGWMVAG